VRVGVGIGVGGPDVTVTEGVGKMFGVVALGIGVAGADEHATAKYISKIEKANLLIAPPFQLKYEHDSIPNP